LLYVGLILILLTGLIIFIVDRQRNKFAAPTIENVSSIKIVPFKVGADTREEINFDLNKKEHFEMAQEFR
jgi:hypothetical protein